MRAFWGLTVRNIKVYLKDKQAVFFSLLTPIIILVLNILFLRGTFISSLTKGLGDLKSLINESDIDSYANLLLLSGVVASSLITVSYSAIVTIVDDKFNKVDYDISSTPIDRRLIILSYLLAGFISSFFITTAIFVVSLLVISLLGNTYLSFVSILSVIGIILIGSLSSSVFLLMIVMFFKSPNSAGAFQGILCAVSGFVIGAYIPLSEFSTPIQTICNIFPASHIAANIRNILLSGVTDNIDIALAGVDNHALALELQKSFCYNANMFDYYFPMYLSIIYTAVLLVITSGIVAYLYTKVYKRK